MAHLNDDVGILVVSGPDCGRFIPVSGRRQTIGRSTTCGIRLDDPALAPHHALVSGSPPDVDIRPLGGEVEHITSGFRVGNTVCWWRAWPGSPTDFDSEPSSARPFHRPPPPVVPVSQDSEPPIEPAVDPEPRPAASPPWTAVIGGAVTGLTVAALTRQWLFAVFSLVTAGVALVTWGLQRIGQRRARRSWTAAAAKNRHEFDRRCGEHARYLARARKDRHRTIGELVLAARDGGPLLWARRTIADVCIGFGSRHVVVVPGARPLAFNDIPVTVDLSAGSILGIHGSRARSVATAIIVRLALEVGPSDWRLLTTQAMPASWEALRRLPHLRHEPLDQHDLAANHGESVHDIVWVTDPEQVARRRAIATRYLEHHSASMIVCARTRGELPSMCTTIIDADDLEVDGLGPHGLFTAMSVLRQWYDPDARQLALPTRARLLDRAPWSEEDIRRSWTSSSARADVGMGVDGMVSIDLDADGPHMIVVGTTGSGKSELLRTVVASMALRASPTEVNVVLVDYKGGSAFDACARLPHVAGVVTDLDAEDGGKAAGRVLRGLEAELRRRERVLRATGASDRAEYQCSQPAEPMPRLVIVVDELAALRVDLPDFVSALVSVAQRGRSLGLHLVLATQRPGTELTPDLVANVSVRVALRLTSREDSRLVLGHATAAAISSRTPGRGSMVLGADGPEDFQTLQVTDDLDEIVARCRSVAETMKIPQVRRPWCDALPRSLALPDGVPAWSVGMVDDPDEQRHVPLIWDRERHLLVTGGSGRGKTSALLTVAAVLRRHDPTARLFAISGRGDQSWRASWVTVGDRERCHRLLRHVSTLIDQRKRSTGEWARVSLLVDDVDVWRSLYTEDRWGSEQWDVFERIVAEGPAVGVTCVLTATRDQGLPAFLMARLDQHWMGEERPGAHRVIVDGRTLTAQVVDPRTFGPSLDRSTVIDDVAAIATLPSVVRAADRSGIGAFARRADDLTDMVLTTGVGLRVLCVGHRGSGRSTVLRALRLAWNELHPVGLVLDAVTVATDPTVMDVAQCGDRPILLVIDDADRLQSAPEVSETISRVIDSEGPVGATPVSVMAATSPNFLRAHADHWLQRLRRSRTGVLLGRCVDEDGDLFGQYGRFSTFVPPAPGRGLWVEDGDERGIVQFVSVTSD